MLYYIFYYIFSSFYTDFTSFYPLLLHFCMKCFKLVDLFVFSWWIVFAICLEIAQKKFFGGHTPAIFLGQYITPPSPSGISTSISIFLYIAYFQFVTILKRSFYHWDGFKNYLLKNSKNRICYHWRVNAAGGHTTKSQPTHTHHPITQYHPISYFLFPISHFHSPLSL